MTSTRTIHFTVSLLLYVLAHEVASFARLPTLGGNHALARVSRAVASTCTSSFVNCGHVTGAVVLPPRRARFGGGVQSLAATLPVVSHYGLLCNSSDIVVYQYVNYGFA